MRQIVNDWKNFCEGVETFEDDYFYTLFMDEISIEEIETIYKYFPNSERLVGRMKQFLFDEAPQVNENDKVQILENLIKLDFEERKPIIEQLPSFSNFNSNPKFIYEENEKVVYNLVLDDIWIQNFQDFMRNQIVIEDDKVWELKSALYGKTYDFDYQLFLFQPLLKPAYTMEYLFRFKKLGGIYAISENTVYFSFKR